MKNTKKLLVLITVIAISFVSLTACDGKDKMEGQKEKDEIASKIDKDEDKDKKEEKKQSKNKYNEGHIDITGKTIGEVADEAGYDYAEFLHTMQLPMDLPEDTYEQAAFYSMPFKAYLENYYSITEEEDLKEFKEYNELDLEITEETTLGEVFDVMMLKYYVGEENLETFKQEYGFGDDVTAETKYGEIRRKVEEHDRDKRIAAETTETEETEETAETAE